MSRFSHSIEADRGPASAVRREDVEQLSPRAELLLRLLTGRGLPYGREDSFKLYHRELLGSRILLGTPTSGLDCREVLRIGAELGMPQCYESLLVDELANANMLLLGLEDREDGGVYKIYLEFWEKLRQRVRSTGSVEPGLLNVGVKWDTTTGSHCRTDYLCYPMLSPADILSRLKGIYSGRRLQPSHDFSAGLIHQAIAREPGASFIYVEVSEGPSPRKSFDLNLYKANLRVSDIRPLLTRLAERYGIGGDQIDQLLGRVRESSLGHLSGGVDRHGRDFATIYYEVSMLPL